MYWLDYVKNSGIIHPLKNGLYNFCHGGLYLVPTHEILKFKKRGPKTAVNGGQHFAF